MALLTLRMLLSIITLNSLLEIYENQLHIDTQFNSASDQTLQSGSGSNILQNPLHFDFLLIACDFLSQYPNFTSFWQMNKIFQVIAQITLLVLILSKKSYFRYIDVVFGLSVIIQNSKYFCDFYSELLYAEKLEFDSNILLNGQSCKIQDKINESNISLSQQQFSSQEVQPKVNVEQFSKQGKRSRTNKIQNFSKIKVESTPSNQLQEKQLCQDQNIIKFRPQVKAEDSKSIGQDNELQKQHEQVKSQVIEQKAKEPHNEQEKPTVEQETENENEVNHGNLSEITSVKDEQKISLLIQLKGVTKYEDCNLDHFETITTEILEKNYTHHQIIQIQIHLLLNLYEGNEDMNFKLWCLKKVLQLVY